MIKTPELDKENDIQEEKLEKTKEKELVRQPKIK